MTPLQLRFCSDGNVAEWSRDHGDIGLEDRLQNLLFVGGHSAWVTQVLPITFDQESRKRRQAGDRVATDLFQRQIKVNPVPDRKREDLGSLIRR